MLLDANAFIERCHQNDYSDEAFIHLMDNVTEDQGKFIDFIRKGYNYYFAYNEDVDKLLICCVKDGFEHEVIEDGFFIADACSIVKKFSH